MCFKAEVAFWLVENKFTATLKQINLWFHLFKMWKGLLERTLVKGTIIEVRTLTNKVGDVKSYG